MMSRSETGRRRRNGNLGVWRKTIRNCFTIHLEEKKKHKKTNQPTKPNKKNKNKKIREREKKGRRGEKSSVCFQD